MIFCCFFFSPFLFAPVNCWIRRPVYRAIAQADGKTHDISALISSFNTSMNLGEASIMDVNHQEPPPEGERVPKSYTVDEKREGALAFINSKKDIFKRNISELSYAEMGNFLLTSFSGDEFEVVDFLTCSVCNLPTLFFHNTKSRCKEVKSFSVDEIEDFLIPSMLKAPIITRILQGVTGDLLRRHQLDMAKSTPQTQIPDRSSDSRPRFKLQEAPLWGKDRHLNYYLEAISSWVRIYKDFPSNEIFYSICSSLERSDRFDVAEMLRSKYTLDHFKDISAIQTVNTITQALKAKYGRTRREEIEFFFNSFKTPKKDDESSISTILRVESDLQHLRNLSIVVDPRICSIQLLQNCRLSQSEIQQVKSLSGNFDSDEIFNNTVKAIKEIASVREISSSIFYGDFNKPRVPKNAGNYKESRRSRSSDRTPNKQFKDRRRSNSSHDKPDQKKPFFKTEMERYLFSELSKLKKTLHGKKPSSRQFFEEGGISPEQELDASVFDVEDESQPLTNIDTYYTDCDVFMLSQVLDHKFYMILDTGCTKSCMSRDTFDNLVKSHPPNFMRIQNKQAAFRFGPSRQFSSNQTVQLNLTILNSSFKVNFFIVDANIPILVGNDILQRSLHASIDTDKNMLTFKDRAGNFHSVDMITLTSGHYAIQLKLTNLYVENEDIYISKAREDVRGRGSRPRRGQPHARGKGGGANGCGQAQQRRFEEDGDAELRPLGGLGAPQGRVQDQGSAAASVRQLEGVLERQTQGTKILNRSDLLKLHQKFGHRSSLWENIRHSSFVLPMHKKVLEDIQLKCKICNTFAKAPPKNKFSFLKSLDFNECVSIDLKDAVNFNLFILFIVDEFSKLIKGKVVNKKDANTIMQAFSDTWIIGNGLGPGIPACIMADNGKEFDNEILSEFGNKLGIKLSFIACYSPFQNGVCERNHATVDILWEKLMADDPSLSLQQAVDLACYSKNLEINKTGFSPFQLAFGRNPRVVSNFDLTPVMMETNFDSERARSLIANVDNARRSYRQIEVDQKIKRMQSERLRAWNNFILSQGQHVWFKNRKDLWRQGRIISIEGQVIHISSEGSILKIPKCNVKPDYTREQEKSRRTDKMETILEEPTVTVDSHKFSEDAQIGHRPKVTFAPQVQIRNIERTRPKVNSYVEITEYDGSKFVGRVEQVGKKSGKMRNFAWVADQENVWIYDFSKDVLDWRYVEPSKLEEALSDDYFNSIDRIFAQLIPRKDQFTEEVLSAKQAEIKGWYDMRCVDEYDYAGQSLVPTHWVVTRKEADDKGQGKIKARLCIRGDLEKTSERTDSPTAGKESIKLFLALVCMLRFEICSIDIKSAFLQGQKPDRNIFVKPPPEANARGKIWLLNRPVYGLRDASRLWFKALMSFFTELKFKVITGDKAFFYLRMNDKVQLLVISHVDDFLLAGSKFYLDWLLEKISGRFKISKVERGTFLYTGMNIDVRRNYIMCSQKEYMHNLVDFDLSKYNLGERADEEGKKLIKKAVGQLNWLALSTRPDLQFDSLELSLNINESTFARLKRANKVFSVARKFQYDIKLNFLSYVPEELKLLLFTDASFGNLQDKIRSTEGRIIFLRVGEYTYPLSWKARKLEKVCLSVKSAETLALVNGIDECIYFKQILETLLGKTVTITAFTDNHALKESIYSTKCVTEKRMERHLEFIRECLAHKEVRVIKWIETKSMLADCLTKSGVRPHELTAILKTGKLSNETFLNLSTQSCGEEFFIYTNAINFKSIFTQDDI